MSVSCGLVFAPETACVTLGVIEVLIVVLNNTLLLGGSVPCARVPRQCSDGVLATPLPLAHLQKFLQTRTNTLLVE